MKNILNLGMDAPLTFHMAHPLEERIDRLSYAGSRHTAVALVIGALSLTVSVTAPAEPTVEYRVVKATLVQETVSAPAPEAVSSPRVKPVVKLARAEVVQTPQATPIAKTVAGRATNWTPMRVRMHPNFTDEQLAKSEALRAKTVAKEKGAKKALDDHYARISYFNRYEVTIDDAGRGFMAISKGLGGWPGYPVINTDWDVRALSTAQERGMKDILAKCAASATPVYFPTVTLEGDADIGRGIYEVECTPGTRAKRAALGRLDMVDAYLNSMELPDEKRLGNMAWKAYFALMSDYVESDTQHSTANDREACLRITQKILNDYTFTDKVRKSTEYNRAKCNDPDYDYNWVRKRMKLPEVQ